MVPHRRSEDDDAIRGSAQPWRGVPWPGSARQRSHSVRLVARVVRIGETPYAPKPVVRGQVHHTVWVPDPEHDEFGAHDWVVDLRTATAVDRVFLNVDRRVAALSGPAWMAVTRRLVHFYTRTALPLQQPALQEPTSIPTMSTSPMSSTRARTRSAGCG